MIWVTDKGRHWVMGYGYRAMRKNLWSELILFSYRAPPYIVALTTAV
jgi:hypothetical protein